MKIHLEIKVEEPEALLAFAEDLRTVETDSKFVIVPQGGAGLNLDSGTTIAILVSFFENGGMNFVSFFVKKIFKCFERDKIKFIVIQDGDNPPTTIYSNMSEETVVRLVQSTLKTLPDGSK